MKSGAISDAQISVSSELDANHGAMQGRLHSKLVGSKKGAWVAPQSEANPWLQIDLLSQNTRITLVATQGRYDDSQWVTKYSLLYSNDTYNFLYYKDQGQQNANKVCPLPRVSIPFHFLFIYPITAKLLILFSGRAAWKENHGANNFQATYLQSR